MQESSFCILGKFVNSLIILCWQIDFLGGQPKRFLNYIYLKKGGKDSSPCSPWTTDQLCKANNLVPPASRQGLSHLSQDCGLRKYMLNLLQLKMQCQLHSITALLSNTCTLPSFQLGACCSLRSVSRWTLSCRVPHKVSQQTRPMIPHCYLPLTFTQLGFYLPKPSCVLNCICPSTTVLKSGLCCW